MLTSFKDFGQEAAMLRVAQSAAARLNSAPRWAPALGRFHGGHGPAGGKRGERENYGVSSRSMLSEDCCAYILGIGNFVGGFPQEWDL